jgi:hypothetical protein
MSSQVILRTADASDCSVRFDSRVGEVLIMTGVSRVEGIFPKDTSIWAMILWRNLLFLLPLGRPGPQHEAFYPIKQS